MRAALVMLLLTGCAATAPAPVARVAHREISVGPCPAAPRLPTAPSSPRTIESAFAWIRKVVVAYEETEADRDECARSLGILERMVE